MISASRPCFISLSPVSHDSQRSSCSRFLRWSAVSFHPCGDDGDDDDEGDLEPVSQFRVAGETFSIGSLNNWSSHWSRSTHTDTHTRSSTGKNGSGSVRQWFNEPVHAFGPLAEGWLESSGQPWHTRTGTQVTSRLRIPLGRDAARIMCCPETRPMEIFREADPVAAGTRASPLTEINGCG